MPARLPIQSKSPFEIDPRPLNETASPHAGLLATSRALRSLKVPDLIAANLPLKQRQRGFSEGQFIETILLLQTLGGDCPEDVKLLVGDRCRSEEHTSELQSRRDLVCRLLLEKKKVINRYQQPIEFNQFVEDLLHD